MADYYLVKLARGAAWDHSRPRRNQARWDEHAAFMDALTAKGVVILGGPMGEGDGEDVLLVVNVENEAAIRARLADDPWANDLLTVKSVEPWSVWLRAPEGIGP
ncbi:MAG: YciI family protein [Gaiellaceae bacterium]